MTRITALISAFIVAVLASAMLTGPVANPLIGAAYAQGKPEVDVSTIVEMVEGDANAPVTIVEYASFTCPHCAAFHNGPYKQLKAEYIDTGKVRLIYRDVYFDKFGLWAAMIARCAGPDRFFGVADLIYKGQAEWVRAGGPTEIIAELRKIGRLAGLDSNALDACLSDDTKAFTLVTWYQQNMERDDIKGTPTFIVNGTLVTNRPYADFKAIIEAELGN